MKDLWYPSRADNLILELNASPGIGANVFRTFDSKELRHSPSDKPRPSAICYFTTLAAEKNMIEI